jgi:integrase
MKTTLKFKLRSYPDASQHCALTLQVIRHRITRKISTSYTVSPAEWDDNMQEIVIPPDASPERRKELSSFSRKMKKDRQLILAAGEMLEAQGDYSSQDLVCHFRKLQHGELFCQFISRKVEALEAAGRFGTAHTYRYAAVSFLKFLGNKDIHIKKITASLMKSFESYLLSEDRSKNTISCYTRSLRAAYNQASGESAGLKKAGVNPFSGVFTGNAKTRKRAISPESISCLSEAKLNETEKKTGIYSPCFSRDLFLFSFYTQGMSFSDMANLKRENIREKTICYNRKKTGQPITVELESCMKKIIERYADSSSDLVFPILRNCKDDYARWKKTGAILKNYNTNLKKLAALAGIDSRLTSHVARHSWASLASQEGIPLATISRGMGHESEKTTRIYISRLDSSDVGRANRQILARISAPALLPAAAGAG